MGVNEDHVVQSQDYLCETSSLFILPIETVRKNASGVFYCVCMYVCVSVSLSMYWPEPEDKSTNQSTQQQEEKEHGHCVDTCRWTSKGKLTWAGHFLFLFLLSFTFLELTASARILWTEPTETGCRRLPSRENERVTQRPQAADFTVCVRGRNWMCRDQTVTIAVQHHVSGLKTLPLFTTVQHLNKKQVYFHRLRFGEDGRKLSDARLETITEYSKSYILIESYLMSDTVMVI